MAEKLPPRRAKMSKKKVLTPEERTRLCNVISFARQNINSPDPQVQKDVITGLGFLWMFQSPPADLADDILWAKIALMNIVGASDDYAFYPAASKSYAKNVLWQCINGYAKKCIHENAKSYVNTGDPELNADNLNEMLSEEWIAAASYIHTYDPERAQPLTFLKQCFLHGIFEWKKKKFSKGVNPSIAGLARRIASVKNQLEADGHEATIQELHNELPSVSLNSIQTALITLEGCQNTASLDACAELVETKAASIPMPEESAIKKEENSAFYDAIKKLPEDEREVYCLINGIDIIECAVSNEPHTASDVADLMSIAQSRVMFLISRAEQDLYTYLTGHRRNERFSPNHRPDNIVSSSCDMIHFLSDDDAMIKADITLFANITDEAPCQPGDGEDDMSDINGTPA